MTLVTVQHTNGEHLTKYSRVFCVQVCRHVHTSQCCMRQQLHAFEVPMRAISMYIYENLVIANQNKRKYKSEINFVINLHIKCCLEMKFIAC